MTDSIPQLVAFPCDFLAFIVAISSEGRRLFDWSASVGRSIAWKLARCAGDPWHRLANRPREIDLDHPAFRWLPAVGRR
jgi:hypothetical protein